MSRSSCGAACSLSLPVGRPSGAPRFFGERICACGSAGCGGSWGVEPGREGPIKTFLGYALDTEGVMDRSPGRNGSRAPDAIGAGAEA